MPICLASHQNQARNYYYGNGLQVLAFISLITRELFQAFEQPTWIYQGKLYIHNIEFTFQPARSLVQQPNFSPHLPMQVNIFKTWQCLDCYIRLQSHPRPHGSSCCLQMLFDLHHCCHDQQYSKQHSYCLTSDRPTKVQCHHPFMRRLPQITCLGPTLKEFAQVQIYGK